MGLMPRLRCCVLGLLAVCLGAVGVTVPAGAGSTTVDDPIFVQGLQWGLEQIDAPAAWASGTGEGVTIAMVDSGVDLTHEDLRAKVEAEISCVGAAGDPDQCRGSAQDDHGHGTHAAGIALASTDNGVGMAGVAPGAKLMAVRVLTNQCEADAVTCAASGSSEDVSAGIRWAADHGADVINLALGGGALQPSLGCSFCEAIDYAWGKGVILVLAAGNDSVLPSEFADEPAVIVSATTRDGAGASYSGARAGVPTAARWPVSAPGGEPERRPADCATGGTPSGVISTYWVRGQANSYACLAGTSMATAHVSGALAVLLSTGLTPQAAIDRLLVSADDLGPPGRDDVYGVGRINLGAAVDPDARPAPPTTVGSATRPPDPTPPGPIVAAPFTSPAEAEADLAWWEMATWVLGLVVVAAGAAWLGWRLTQPNSAR